MFPAGNIETIELIYMQMYAPTTLAPPRDFWTLRYTTSLEDGSLVVCERSLSGAGAALSGSTAFQSSPPVFTFANQAGLDMLETTQLALQDIALDKIFDESGQKALYFEFAKIMQQVAVDGNSYHRPCFKCAHGGCVISPSNYVAHKGRLYCKHHSSQLFKKGNFCQLAKDIYEHTKGVTENTVSE